MKAVRGVLLQSKAFCAIKRAVLSVPLTGGCMGSHYANDYGLLCLIVGRGLVAFHCQFAGVCLPKLA